MLWELLGKIKPSLRFILKFIVSGVFTFAIFCQPASAADVDFAPGDKIEVRLYYGVNPDDGKSYVKPQDQKVTVHYTKSLEQTSKTFYILPGQHLIFEGVETGTIRRTFPDNLILEDLLSDPVEDHKVIHKKFSGEVIETLADVRVTEVKIEALSANYFLNVEDSLEEIAISSEITFQEVGDGIPRLNVTVTGGESFPPTVYHAEAEWADKPAEEPDTSGGVDEGKNQNGGRNPASAWDGWTCSLGQGVGQAPLKDLGLPFLAILVFALVSRSSFLKRLKPKRISQREIF